MNSSTTGAFDAENISRRSFMRVCGSHTNPRICVHGEMAILVFGLHTWERAGATEKNRQVIGAKMSCSGLAPTYCSSVLPNPFGRMDRENFLPVSNSDGEHDSNRRAMGRRREGENHRCAHGKGR